MKIFCCIYDSWADVATSFKDYKHHFGCYICGVFFSPYFVFSLVFSTTLLTTSFYTNRDFLKLPTEVLPNLLGFTIGGYALLISIGSDRFREFLAGHKTDDGKPLLLVAGSTFLHAVIFQTASILSALFLCEFQYKSNIVDIIFMTFFIYALLMVLATVFAIYTISTWYVAHCNTNGSS